MAMKAPSATYRIFAHVAPYFTSVRMGGVVGDAKHVATGGYHISRRLLRANGFGGDYSIACPADKDGGEDFASAIDLTYGRLDELVTLTRRLRKACEDGDPRVEPLREHIGTLDGRNVCGYNRVATGSGSRGRVGWTASGFSDKSHLWHGHLSILRRYNNVENDMLGIAEVCAGLAPGKLGWRDPNAVQEPAKPGSTPTNPTPQKPDVPAAVVKVSLKALLKAMKADPDRPQGGTTEGSVDSVKAVEWALLKGGFLPKEFAEDGSAGSSTKVAYAKWQRKLGYRGADADGYPGTVSLTKLGEKYGFKVVA